MTRRILRAFENGIVSTPSSVAEVEDVHESIPWNHRGWRETETALLEAEREKAEALAEWRRRSFNY